MGLQQHSGLGARSQAALTAFSAAVRLLARMASANASLALALVQMPQEPDLVTMAASALSTLPELPAANGAHDVLLSCLGAHQSTPLLTFLHLPGPSLEP